MKTVSAICVGASLGALLRWCLASLLNGLHHALPLGTLCANLLGSFLIGVALEFFACSSTLPAEWRHLIVTGFLGGLTTFSSFSAEAALSIRQERLLSTAFLLLTHVAGSIAMTLLGMRCFELLRRG